MTAYTYIHFSITGKNGFQADMPKTGILFPPIGSTVTIEDRSFPVKSVDWDITQDLVRVTLEVPKVHSDPIDLRGFLEGAGFDISDPEGWPGDMQ